MDLDIGKSYYWKSLNVMIVGKHDNIWIVALTSNVNGVPHQCGFCPISDEVMNAFATAGELIGWGIPADITDIKEDWLKTNNGRASCFEISPHEIYQMLLDSNIREEHEKGVMLPFCFPTNNLGNLDGLKGSYKNMNKRIGKV